MWEAPLVRDGASLTRSQVDPGAVATALETVGVAGDPSLNTAWQDWLSLRNQVLASRLITARRCRRESRGALFAATSRRRRRDRPSRCACGGCRGPVVATAPVELTPVVSPTVASRPPSRWAN